MAGRIKEIPHFRQTVQHRRRVYHAVCFVVLATFSLAVYLFISHNRLLVGQVLSYWCMFTPAYVVLYSYIAYRIRRQGAPIAVMSVTLVWNALLIVWYTSHWSRYPYTTSIKPAPAQVLLVALIPLLLLLPFFRSIKHVKNDFRELAMNRRKAMSRKDRAIGSIAASKNIFDLIRQSVAPRDGYIAVYSAVGSELSLESLVVNLGRAGYRIAFPAIIGEGIMRFYTTYLATELDLQSLDLIADPMGVKDAEALRGLKLVEPRMLSVVIVPGVAFGEDRYRMGFGGGFYDRYLPKLRETTKTYGICFDEQIYKSLPVEHHDQRLDAVVTPTTRYHAKQ